MRRVPILLLTLTIGLSLGLAVPQARADTRLPHLKKIPRCSVLRHLHGTARDKHLLWHLAPRGQYRRMYATIVGESRWHARVVNASGYAGYAQFGTYWYAQHWHFDPRNGPTNIRVFVYCIEHPRETGGWSNWAGH